MLKVIKELLLKVIDNIDSGNSNISEEEGVEIIGRLKELTDKTQMMSKYQACAYLNVSRATFDNYVREGKLPKGKKMAGFNELSWNKKELDLYLKNFKK